MPLYRFDTVAGSLTAVPSTTFLHEQVRERQDLQRALRDHIEVLGDDLLVVSEEYGAFQDSKRRVDLLALDRRGRLVVIELKRTEDGGHMELQALRYAAMVSTMTLDQLVETYVEHHGGEPQEARATLLEHVEDDGLEELSSEVRIVLVAADFSTEITATVLWLNEQYGLAVECWRLTPYAMGTQLLLDVQQIIPLPEAADFRVHQRRKGASTALALAAGEGRDYGRYEVTVGGTSHGPSSKQAAVRQAVASLAAAGVPGALLRAATSGGRWRSVTLQDGEDVERAFRRQHPDRTGGQWFDLNVTDEEGHWVMPRLGGTRTEKYLDALEAASGIVPFRWRRLPDD